MKLGLMKRVIATGICVTMLLGGTFHTAASGTVSGGDAVNFIQADNTVSNGDAVSGNDLVDVVLETEVNGVTIILTAPAGAIPENAELWAKEIDQTAELAIIDEALEAEAKKEEIEVQKYKAFDIKIMVNGEEVQPAEGVTVSFAGDILLPQTEEESVTVYHVTKDAVASDMEATVTENNEVAMETTHFSIYVIVVKDVTDTRTVTIKHYLGTPGNATMIYAPSTLTVDKDHQITSQELPVQGGGNYQLNNVIVKANGKDDVTYTNDFSNTQVTINLTSTENTIEMYYSEVAKQDVPFATTFYDYYIDDAKETTKETYYSVGINQWDILYNFKIGNKNYSGTPGVFGVVSMGENGKLRNYSTQEEIILTPGTVIENVTRQNSNYTDTKKWDKLTYIGGQFCVYGTVTVKASKSAGINAENYIEGMPFLAMGISNDTNDVPNGDPDHVTSYANYGVVNKNNVAVNINANNTESSGVGNGDAAIVSGLITGLTGAEYEDVVMGYASPITGRHDGAKYVVQTIDRSKSYQIQEPGYFTKNTSDNKAVLENYELRFDSVGYTYSLDYAVNKQNGNKSYSWISGTPWNGGQVNNKFLPLNDAPLLAGRRAYQPYAGLNDYYDNNNNYYFGMRYDLTFSLGSYIGPMTYGFYGDDDLWVFVDGKPVMDLGGMHSAYPGKYQIHNEENEVDLWMAVFGIDTSKENWWESDAYKNLDKNKEHQVTILYMERGGFESTCAMRFVIPNVEAKAPVISNVPEASLELVKMVEGTNAVIEGVGFTLYTDAECQHKIGNEKITDANGKVTFTDLREGTYYLKETTWDSNAFAVDANKTYKVNVTLSADETVATATVEGLNKSGNAYVVYNKAILKIDVPFKKIDRYNHSVVLQGAVFTLKENDINGNVIATATSAADGSFVFEDLKAGTYFMEEIQAPEGYRTPESGVGLTIVIVEENNKLKYTIASNNYDQLYYMESYGENLVKNVKGIDVTITKEWTDCNNQMIEAPEEVAEIKVELYRKWFNASKNAWDNDERVPGQAEIVLNADNNWTATVENLDYRNDGGVWTYYVVEKTEVPGFTVEYSDAVVDTGVEGAYNIQLTITNKQNPGALKITKTVDKVDAVHGEASFTFKITCPDNSVLFRTMTFTAGGTKEVTITDLPAGTYMVEELEALRYELADGYEKVQTKEVKAEQTTVYEYSNVKEFDKYYSHTDVVVNVVVFNRDAEGNVTAEISQETSSTDVVEVK